MAVTSAVPDHSALGGQGGSTKQAVLTGLLIAVPLVVLVIVLGWWLSYTAPEVRLGASEPQRSTAPEALESPAELAPLARARRALEAGRIASPAGDNALEIYLAIPADSPEHASAREALIELVPLAVREAESDLANEEFEEAERIRRLIARADPQSLAVANLERAIAQARTRRDAAEAQRAANPLVAERSALAPPNQATTPAPEAPSAERAPPPSTATPSRAELATPQPSAGLAAAPAPSIAARTEMARSETAVDARADAPSNPSRPVSNTASTNTATGNTLINPIPVNQITPRYPPQAMRLRQEGSVVLEFVIQVDGSVRDVRVVQANPPQVFDREALRTALRWRFEPRLVDGRPVEARARRTINFRLGS